MMHEDAYLANKKDAKEDAKLKTAAELQQAMIKNLNANSHLESLGNVIYADYATAMSLFERTGQLEKYEDAVDEGNIFALRAGSSTVKGIKQLQYDLLPDYGIKAVELENIISIPTEDADGKEIKGNILKREKEIQRLLNNSINIDKASQNYLEGRTQNNNPLIDE